MYIMFYNCDNITYAINGIIETFTDKAIDKDCAVTYDAIKRTVKILFPVGVVISKDNIETLSMLLKSYDYEIYTELVID